MELSIFKCDSCGFSHMPAKSNRVARCPNCAHIAKYGITIFEAKMNKLREARIRAVSKAKLAVPHRKAAVKKASRKGIAQALAVSKMKRGVKAGAINGGYVQCAGCGGHFDTIDASHKVPLSQSAALAAAPENISLLCRGCHNKWEHGTVAEMVSLDCFLADMEYLAMVDRPRFMKIYYRVLDGAFRTGDGSLSSASRRLDKIIAGLPQ